MKPRYKLRTLLILLAVLPPLLWLGWTKYEAWRAEQERREFLIRQQVEEVLTAVQASQSATQATMKAARDALAEAELAAARPSPVVPDEPPE